jgi:methylmalonyl-CoA epimerase
MKSPTKIAHIGIAVHSLDEVLPFYRDQLGMTVSEILELPERGLRIAMLPCGESILELMEPMGEASQIQRFLDKRGPGIHHMCLGGTNLQARLDSLAEDGVKLINPTPEIGAEGLPVAFIHPKATGGVLLELIDDE